MKIVGEGTKKAGKGRGKRRPWRRELPLSLFCYYSGYFLLEFDKIHLDVPYGSSEFRGPPGVRSQEVQRVSLSVQSVLPSKGKLENTLNTQRVTPSVQSVLPSKGMENVGKL